MTSDHIVRKLGRNRLLVFGLSLLLLIAAPVFSQSFDLYLLRHFEKQKIKPDPPLHSMGAERAVQLVRILADEPITRIYSTDYRRTQQSVRPLAEALGLPVMSYLPPGLAQTAALLRSRAETSVVSGHSNTTPKLVALLGGEAPEIGEFDYGVVYHLRYVDGQLVEQREIPIPVATR